MEITLDKKNTTEGIIKVKLQQADYKPTVDEKVKDYARKASIKGFRPGKVPTGVINRMFGKSILVEEINQLLSQKLNEYIRENKLRIIGDPLPVADAERAIDWENQKDFEFDYQIGMVEDFTYELSQKVKIKSYPIEVDEKVIAETVTDLKKRFGKVNYPETSEAGDNLIGELSNEDGSFKKEAVFIQTDKVSKKEQKKFIGLIKEDVVSLDIEKLFDDHTDLAQVLDTTLEEAKATKGKYTLKLSSISRTEPADVNQELFDRVFGKDAVKSEEEFTQKIKETIQGNYQRETDHFLEHFIEDHFISNTKINLPEGFLRTWLKATSKGQVTDEVLGQEFDAYIRSLRWDLIKNKIAEDNNIKVEAEEVKARAKEMIIAQFGGPAIASQLADRLDTIADNYLSNENGQNFMKLYNQLRNERIMKHIKENISINEKKVSVEEFKKIVEEHRH
ncbi:MAG: trigger factor [Cyclobacteriaceae bacterium]|nr:trigger factor [Cyclobacteriaceae bacterium]UYN87529.1 MAG: trigger factor [Cyclobacteriaceae bacterium]